MHQDLGLCWPRWFNPLKLQFFITYSHDFFVIFLTQFTPPNFGENKGSDHLQLSQDILSISSSVFTCGTVGKVSSIDVMGCQSEEELKFYFEQMIKEVSWCLNLHIPAILLPPLRYSDAHSSWLGSKRRIADYGREILGLLPQLHPNSELWIPIPLLLPSISNQKPKNYKNCSSCHEDVNGKVMEEEEEDDDGDDMERRRRSGYEMWTLLKINMLFCPRFKINQNSSQTYVFIFQGVSSIGVDSSPLLS